jgi:hypothetical protein
MADNQPSVQWTAIVRAMRSDGKNFRPAANEKNLLVGNVTEQFAAVRQVVQGNP